MFKFPRKSILVLSFFFLIINNLCAQSITDQQILLKGVKEIPLPPDSIPVMATYPMGYQTQVIAYGNMAADSTQQLFAPGIITSRLGKGKILVIGSAYYLNHSFFHIPEITQFWKNVLQWAKTGTGSMAFNDSAFGNVAALAKSQNLPAYQIKNKIIDKNTQSLFVSKDVEDSSYLKKVEQFVLDGGTLIYVSDLWNAYKAGGYVNYGVKIDTLLMRSGLYHVMNPITAAVTKGKFLTDSIPLYLNVDTILANISNSRYHKFFFNHHSEIIPQAILKLIFAYASKTSGAYIDFAHILSDPKFDNKDSASLLEPLYTKNWPDYFRYLQRIVKDDSAAEKNHRYRASTNAAFPGIIADTVKRISKSVTIHFSNKWGGLAEPDTSFKRWYSTGLYVAAGDEAKIILARVTDTSRKIVAQIGAHEDKLFDQDYFTRNPNDLTKKFNLNKDTTTIYSPYGGLLYLDIPLTDTGNSFSAKAINVVNAPYFQMGKTSQKDWIETIRNYPAPWAELATDKLILTVPSDSIRNLDDPEKLMKFWNEVMDADADLAIAPRKRNHPERIIAENQVAAGYMFTDTYRIVVPIDESLSWMLNEKFMRASGSWGHFHELGHRHQFWGIDFDELGEVSVNLYSVYVCDTVLHKGIFNNVWDDNLNKDKVDKVVKAYLKHPDYNQWKKDPYLELVSLYYPIIEKWGWAPILRLNQHFREIYNKDYKGISWDSFSRSNEERTDQYFVSLSNAVGRNLTNYFDKLKIPISENAKKRVFSLPEWLPDDWQQQ